MHRPNSKWKTDEFYTKSGCGTRVYAYSPRLLVSVREGDVNACEKRVSYHNLVVWAGMGMNASNDICACIDGTIIVVQNDYTKEYNRAYNKISEVNLRGDAHATASAG